MAENDEKKPKNAVQARKERFLQALKQSGGIISPACENAGIVRRTYELWRKNDPAFASQADDVIEEQIDFVESVLMNKIQQGDTTATIFYLKTRGKKRGWSEKMLPTDMQTEKAVDGVQSVEIKKRIKNKKDYIIKLLKSEGKYTAELSMQVSITAQLLVRADLLAENILADGHQAIDIEYSREGNERKSVNPTEKLYLDVVQQAQRALRALGMNTDSKERRTDSDAFADFMNDFKDD